MDYTKLKHLDWIENARNKVGRNGVWACHHLVCKYGRHNLAIQRKYETNICNYTYELYFNDRLIESRHDFSYLFKRFDASAKDGTRARFKEFYDSLVSEEV